MSRIILFLPICFLFLSSCNKPVELNEDELLEWYSDHIELFQFSKNIDGILYTLNITPQNVQLAKKLKKGLDSTKVYSENGFIFNFRISKQTGSGILYHELRNPNEYFDRVNYYSFDVERDFRLIAYKDTISCIGSHFERTYELTPYVSINVTFNTPDDFYLKNKEITFEFIDRVFNNGKIKLIIPYKNITIIPKLRS